MCSLWGRYAVVPVVVAGLLMQPARGAVLGDFDTDGDVDLPDFSALSSCLAGPDIPAVVSCSLFDLTGDPYVDLADFGIFQTLFTGSCPSLTLVAERGTPADEFLASANVGQEMLICGVGLTAESEVTFPIRNHLGVAGGSRTSSS